MVVIGESFNKYHSSLYGYSHNTNPNLLEERRKGNLYVFTNAISPYNMTSSVIKNVFSTNSIMNKEYWYNKPVFIVLFKNLGYKVFFWDNQKSDIKGGAVDFSLNSFLYNDKVANLSYNFVNNKVYKYDGDLFSDFCLNAKLGNRNLVIFHLMGQHFSVSDRYPKNKGFDIFNIDSINKRTFGVSAKSYISYYDNATIYNDYVLEKIINKFRNRNSILFYFSDHGEEVYDYRNMVGRTHESKKTKEILKYQYEIPFMIWCSNSYIDQHKNFMKKLVRSLNKPYMIDNLSHLLFDVGNVSTPYYKSSCDIISNNYKCLPRIVQDDYNYDMIMNY